MVSIFDDEVEEVGSEIDAYCPKCKADTTHVIISKYEDEIRRVQCNPCSDVHAFRKPRGEMEEEPPEPIAVKKRAAKVKPTWEQVMTKAKKQPRLYMVAERYGENEVLSHPKFGTGFVSDVIGLDKIEVTFQSEKRVLIHNRAGMSLPPAAYAHVMDVSQLENDRKKAARGDKGKANGKAAPAGHAPATRTAEKKPAAAAAAKKAPEKPTAVTKAKEKHAAQKAPAGKAAANKPSSKKAAPRKPAKKKPASKKPVKKAAAKRPARKASPKKPVKKAAAKKPVKKAAAKKPAKKAAAKKPAKKASPKKPGKKAHRAPAKAAKKKDKKKAGKKKSGKKKK